MSDPLENELHAQMKWLRRLALALVHDPALAEDLVQDTWIAALRARPRFEGSLRPWLGRVIRNMVTSRARNDRSRKRWERLSAEAESLPSAETLTVRYEAMQLLGQMVSVLDEPYRTTVRLCYGEELSPSEVARRQGLPAGTVRWRLKHALDTVRARLDEHYGDRRRWSMILVGVLPAAKRLGKTAAAKPTLGGIGLAPLAVVGTVALVALTLHGLGRPAAEVAANGGRSLFDFAGTSKRQALVPSAARAELALPSWIFQRNVAKRRIAGRVTFDGQPMPGVRLMLGHALTKEGAVPPLETESTVGGAFDFGLQPAAVYQLAAATHDHAMTVRAVDLRDPVARPAPDRIEVALGGCENALSGRVLDAVGTPIEGAKVRLDGLLGMDTDAGGNYRLCAGRGQTDVLVSASGYGVARMKAAIEGAVRRDVILLPQVSVSGRVVRASDGSPVAGAHVHASPPETARTERGAAMVSTLTDADGRFRLPSLEPGRWLFSADAEDLDMLGQFERVLVVGGNSDEVVLRIEATRRLVGRLVEGGRPVPGVQIFAASKLSARRSSEAVTQLDGSFALQLVPTGPLNVIPFGWEVVSVTPPLDASAPKDLLVEVRRQGVVRGRVLRGGLPVEGARVRDGCCSRRVLSQPDGSFELPGVAPGPHVISASNERVGASSRKVSVSLTAGQILEGVDLELEQAGQVSGVVVDEQGKPVPTAWVNFQPPGGGRGTRRGCTTDFDGKFTCTMLRAGVYQPNVFATHADDERPLRPVLGDVHPTVVLNDNGSKVSAITLSIKTVRLSLSGQVLDERGAPVADARIEAQRQNSDIADNDFYFDALRSSQVTDGEGRFELHGLLAGHYALRARTPRGGEAIVRGVAAGAKGVVIATQRPSRVEGVLAGFTELPRVFVESSTTHDSWPAETHGATFSVAGLPPGRYVISAESLGEGDIVEVDVPADRPAKVTLTNRGGSSVSGRVVEFGSNEPIAGATCHAFIWAPTTFDVEGWELGKSSDAAGHFALDVAPAGDIGVHCHTQDRELTVGTARVTVAKGAKVQVEVIAVRGKVSLDPQQVGFQVDQQLDGMRISQVFPGSWAAAAGMRAGDNVTALDGVSLAGISDEGFLKLIGERLAGPSTKLTVVRQARSQNIVVSLAALAALAER